MELQQRTIYYNNKDGPNLLVTGGVHGDEFETMETARRLIHELKPS